MKTKSEDFTTFGNFNSDFLAQIEGKDSLGLLEEFFGVTLNDEQPIDYEFIYNFAKTPLAKKN